MDGRGAQSSRDPSSPSTANVDTKPSSLAHETRAFKSNVYELLLQLAKVNDLPENKPAALVFLNVGERYDWKDGVMSEGEGEEEHDVHMHNSDDEKDEDYEVSNHDLVHAKRDIVVYKRRRHLRKEKGK